MSRSDARETPGREAEARSAHPAARPAAPWSQALGRDAREFAQTAECEFRKLVGASCSTIQRQPPRAAPDRFERRPLGRRKSPANAPPKARENRDPRPAAPKAAEEP
ncbi:MAG: hypothetical protein ACRD2E_00645 [Terriglobales bacterium]